MNFTHVDNNTTHVVTTLWANAVGWDDGAAAAAYLQLLWFLVMVCSTLAGTSVGVSSLGNCHFAISRNKWPRTRPCDSSTQKYLGNSKFGQGKLKGRRVSVKSKPGSAWTGLDESGRETLLRPFLLEKSPKRPSVWRISSASRLLWNVPPAAVFPNHGNRSARGDFADQHAARLALG